MVEIASFDDLVVSVRRIESSALPKSDFPEKIDARRVLEFSPTKFLDQGYHEILNDYSVIQKIISTSKLDIFTSGAGEERKVPQMQTMEIESKVKEITSAALESRMKLEEVTVPPPIEEFEAEKGQEAEKVSAEKSQIQKSVKLSKSSSVMSFESDFDKELESEFKLDVETGEKEKVLSFEKPPVKSFETEAKKSEKPKFESFKEEKEEVVAPQFEFETESGGEAREEAQKEQREFETEKERKPTKFATPPVPEEKEKAFEKPSEESLPENQPVVEEVHPELKHAEPKVPPLLLQRSEEAGARHFEKMEEHFKSEWGAGMSESDIRKKMVELTRELFKEKLTTRKEELKAQIVMLKGMLGKGEGVPVVSAPISAVSKSGNEEEKEVEKQDKKARALAALRALKERRKIGAGKDAGKETPAVPEPAAIAKSGYSTGLLETVSNTQRVELTSAKENVLSSFSSKIQEFRDQFNSSVAALEEDEREEGKKKAYDKFIFSLTALKNQLPAFSTKFESFIAKKHSAELEKLKESVEKEDPKGAAAVSERLAALQKSYAEEFGNVRDIISRNIDSVIDSMGPIVFVAKKEAEEVEKGEAAEKEKEDASGKKGAIKPKEKKLEKSEKFESEDILREVNGMDDGSLLYYLHSTDKETYRQYERKHISKHEAVFKAKRLIAKERGMSAVQLAKYFGKG